MTRTNPAKGRWEINPKAMMIDQRHQETRSSGKEDYLWLQFAVSPQPTDTSCGQTCLQAVYSYFGDSITMTQLLREVPELEDGGTLAVHLGSHALRRGYRAVVYTFNLRIFDPTWFSKAATDFRERLAYQTQHRSDPKSRVAARAYLDFYDQGGSIRFKELTATLLRSTLRKRLPILAGLSATFLYQTAREIPATNSEDDLRGEPCGHFVVLCGYHRDSRQVLVADPYRENPIAKNQLYWVDMDRLINAILLGVFTYDGNLLILDTKSNPKDAERPARC